MLHIPSDDHIVENIHKINSKQHIVLNICHKWAKDYMKAFSLKGNSKIDPIHLFISDGEGTEKSDLVITIYQVVSKEFLYHAKNIYRKDRWYNNTFSS